MALLLLGHMRSGSTLVLHLLLTNPQIAALGERNVRYALAADLARLALSARMAQGRPLRRFLDLTESFSPTYATHAFTQTRGDPGPKISTGRILPPGKAPAIDLEPQQLARLLDAYARCHATLSSLDLCPA
jgi:hypothetical protein